MEYERSRKGPPDEFPALPPIPAGRYNDPDFLDLEQRFLWKRSWLYACHTDELPEPGSFILWTRAGSPIIIVRGKDRQIRAFYNTCRHRGGPLVNTESGKVKSGFVCGYHGWTYDLEGRLKAVPDRRDFVDLELDCIGLLEVRCEQFGNWLFINEDPNAEALVDSLAPIASQLEPFELDSLRHVDSHGFDVKCNVKVMLEAFLEVYHLKSVHKDTVDRFLDPRGTHIRLWPRGHSIMVTPNRREDWQDSGTRGMAQTTMESDFSVRNNLSYNIYPNLISPVSPSGIPFLVFWPTGSNSMYVECHWFAPDWGGGERDPLWDTRIENFDRILAEDLDFAPLAQLSMQSPGFKGIKLNYQERRIYHWHEELDRRIGREHIDDSLRVQPRLAKLIEAQLK